MKIVISGSTGLIGTSLVRQLTGSGSSVTRLVRSNRSDNEPAVQWNPAAGFIESASVEGFDAAVHLAGEGIANHRWSEAQKAKIRESRVQGTDLLCRTLAGLKNPPRVLVSASAIGYYGDRGDQEMKEDCPPGAGFLADVCSEWEAATRPASQAGIRVALVRIGVVLSPRGGALAKMLLPFRLGLGGRVGDGRQYMSWVALDDIVNVFQHILENDSMRGAVNGVAPNAVTNYEFTKTLGGVLGRPTIFPMPAFAARLAFGEMANELLLSSTRVVPTCLQGSGFEFRFPQLHGALEHLLTKPAA